MKSKFNVDYVSDSEYENLTIEISFDEQLLCQINQDRGKEHLEIEFFHQYYLDKNDYRFKFSLKDFLSIIDEAVSDLD